MRKIFLLSLIFILFLLLIAGTVSAKGLKASIAEMPIYAENKDKGILVDLVKAIAEVSAIPIEICVVPFKRSVFYVTSGKTDFHLPLIKNPETDENKLDYDYAAETIFHVNFVLYSYKNMNIDISKIQLYKIETDLAHTDYFNFPITGSSRIENSLKKANVARIDGFIFADNVCDAFIKKNNLKNIRRQLYKSFEVKIILPKGGQGKETDNILTSAIKKLRETGRYAEIMGQIDYPYNDWQP